MPNATLRSKNSNFKIKTYWKEVEIFNYKGFVNNNALMIKNGNGIAYQLKNNFSSYKEIVENIIKKKRLEGKINLIENILIPPYHAIVLLYENIISINDFARREEYTEKGGSIIRISAVNFDGKVVSVIIKNCAPEQGHIEARDTNNNII